MLHTHYAGPHQQPVCQTRLAALAAPRHLAHARRRAARKQLIEKLQPLITCSTHPSYVAHAAIVEEQPVVASTSGHVDTNDVTNPPTYVTATGRIVAIGDLHGDWNKAIEAFQAAGCISINQNNEVVWCGGDTVVVQLGDVLDRGDNEIAIIKLLRGLDYQARSCGGAVYMLNGNHESLNVCGNFRYVTPGAFVESAVFGGLQEDELRDWQRIARMRYSVYRPGGVMAQELSKNPTVLVVNDTAFAHGGLLPVHVNYGLERINTEVAAWMRGDDSADGGKSKPPFLAMGDASSVMWNRTLSRERWPTPHEQFQACSALQQALERINAKRLVVGHTPQEGGANCACDGCVWRMDVGMSYGVLNRPAQVLEIVKKEDGQTHVRILPSETQLEDATASVEL